MNDLYNGLFYRKDDDQKKHSMSVMIFSSICSLSLNGNLLIRNKKWQKGMFIVMRGINQMPLRQ